MPTLREPEEILQTVSATYRPWLHLSLTVGSGIVIVAIALVAIDDLRALELLVVPPMFVLANLGEWTAHKWILHRRIPGATLIYDEHTRKHHAVYRYGSFAMRRWQELRLILIPPFGVALITIAASPLALLVALVISPNAGWLIAVTSALYIVSYEVLHLAYHLPEQHPIARLSIMRRLREHHRRHHHPRVMQKWNFNVVIPIGDWIFGTWLSEQRFAELTRRDR